MGGFLSLQVQCEYEASDLKRAADMRSLYAVTNPPPVVALGTIRVLMRIAKGNKMGVLHRVKQDKSLNDGICSSRCIFQVLLS